MPQLRRLLLLATGCAALSSCLTQPHPPAAAPARSGRIVGRVALRLEPPRSPSGVVVKLVLNDGLESAHRGTHLFQVLNRTFDFPPELLTALRGPGLFSQTIDASGAFAFGDLPAGLYYVDLSIAGSVFGSSERLSELTVPDVRVTDGTTQDLGLLTLRKPVNPMDDHRGHETY